jgi:hypothetical protein
MAPQEAGPAQGRRTELTPEVIREKIRAGVEYLKNQQLNGNWDDRTVLGINGGEGGITSLVMLALLESGVDPTDEVIQKGLDYLRRKKPRETYVVALQTMVLAHAFPEKDKLQIRENVQWLEKTVKRDGQGRLAGWSYPTRGGTPDNSNSQYAVLALREAGLVGAPIDDQLWKEILDFYKRTQLQNGGWPYHNSDVAFGAFGDERITMTCAGVCGLLIAGMQLYRNNEIIRNDGLTRSTISNCGHFERNDPLARGFERIAERFTVNYPTWKFYNLYGIERAGRLSGQRFFTGPNGRKVDWYRAGAEHLVNTQFPEGCWRGDSVDGNPIIATSFSLLFLAKGKTPVLIHKMMHGKPADLRTVTGDWNNDRNDVRNLTEYCSQQIFRNKKTGRPLPLTWQVFNAAQLDARSEESVKELLQAPILFFNGHQAPQFTDAEEALLRQFVDQGGFIFAEQCCGGAGPQAKTGFDKGFRELVKRVWPDRELAPLADSHAIWSSFAKIPPGSFKLEGIDFGCKTCLVFSPEDLSCHWETNHTKDNADARTLLAFRLGANVVAYATGLEPPQDKLSAQQVVSNVDEPIQRGFFQAAQIDYGGRDWQPAPRAMRNLSDYLHKLEGVDVLLQTKPLVLSDVNLPKFKFLYMHGRREFTIGENERKALREHLDGGALLLADACCGSEAFDKAFRTFVQEMFGRNLEPIDKDDLFFSEKVGKDIKSAMGRTQRGVPYAPMSPQFEGIRLDPKNPKSQWVVIYSKYDLGCALDKHASTDCLGYSHESALELAAQAVLYALKE